MVKEGEILTAKVYYFVGDSAIVLIPPNTAAFLSTRNISWRIKNPKAQDYFNVGDDILIKVLSVKYIEGKMPQISVGFRETEANPWPLVPSIHPPGTFSDCRVSGFLKFGALVLLPSGFQALLHNDELSWDREIKRAEDFLQLGQKLKVQIKEAIPEKQKISVILKDALANPYKNFAAASPELQSAVGIVTKISKVFVHVKLQNGCYGRIHSSRIPDKLRDEFSLGDRVDVRVISLDPEKQSVELEFDVEAIYEEWERVLDAGGGESSPPSDFGLKLVEGAKKVVTVNYYERNPKARKKCIEYHGTSCAVCGFSFAKTYGEIGNGFVHVHHLSPIGDMKGEYQLDPIKDLRPVCSNCHSILHRKKPPFSIEELKAVFLEQVKRIGN